MRLLLMVVACICMITGAFALSAIPGGPSPSIDGYTAEDTARTTNDFEDLFRRVGVDRSGGSARPDVTEDTAQTISYLNDDPLYFAVDRSGGSARIDAFSHTAPSAHSSKMISPYLHPGYNVDRPGPTNREGLTPHDVPLVT